LLEPSLSERDSSLDGSLDFDGGSSFLELLL